MDIRNPFGKKLILMPQIEPEPRVVIFHTDSNGRVDSCELFQSGLESVDSSIYLSSIVPDFSGLKSPEHIPRQVH